jgi:IPT/TIG domain/Papain family cysteine protease
MKNSWRRKKAVKGWRGCGKVLPLIFGVIILLLLSSPFLLAGIAPVGGGAPVPETPIQLPQGAVSGDGVHYLGLQPSGAAADAFPQIEVPGSMLLSLEASADLSSQLPPVGNQGSQGSCVAWSTSYYYKSWSEKQEHTGWNLSNTWYQFSPSFMYNQINGGADNGATFTDAFTLLQNKGDVDIAEMPYSQSDYRTQPTAAKLEAAKPYRIASTWAYFWKRSTNGPYSSPNNIDNIKAWLNSGKVLVMAIPVYYDFPNYGSNPAKTYYDHTGSSLLAGGHGVCICGYDDNINPSGSSADHQGGFKMVNSWGASWNGSNAGYVYLSYDFVKRYVWEAWSMTDLSPDAPTITSLSTTSGAVGTTIHIYGKNFGTLRRNARVSFNGVNAVSPTFTDGDITAKVPTGATTGSLTVYDWDGAVSNAVTFTVPGTVSGPQVTSISPSSVAEGTTTVSIDNLAGANFVNGATVRLEGNGLTINATSVSWVSSTQITCTFDLTGATVGAYDVVVKNPDSKEGRLTGGFNVTTANPCGLGAGLGMLGVTLGLISLAGTEGVRRKRRRRRTP